jgi:Myb-like DNA-binding domain
MWSCCPSFLSACPSAHYHQRICPCSSGWGGGEETRFIEALRACGKDFTAISLHMGSKTVGAVKKFFSKNRK